MRCAITNTVFPCSSSDNACWTRVSFSGRVLLGGVDVTTVEPETLFKNYSIVFQEVTLFDQSVMENIRLGRQNATDEEVLAAAGPRNARSSYHGYQKAIKAISEKMGAFFPAVRDSVFRLLGQS